MAEGKEAAKKLRIDYWQLSAKTGQNIDQLFEHLIDMLLESRTNGVGNVLDSVMKEIAEQKREQEQSGTQSKTAPPNNNTPNSKQDINRTNGPLNINNLADANLPTQNSLATRQENIKLVKTSSAQEQESQKSSNPLKKKCC